MYSGVYTSAGYFDKSLCFGKNTPEMGSRSCIFFIFKETLSLLKMAQEYDQNLLRKKQKPLTES
jgi:hypothetical protein